MKESRASDDVDSAYRLSPSESERPFMGHWQLQVAVERPALHNYDVYTSLDLAGARSALRRPTEPAQDTSQLLATIASSQVNDETASRHV